MNRQNKLDIRSILTNRINLRFLIVAGLSGILQFSILKILYPFPDFISDSYNYLETSIQGLNVNVWPIGYSRFLSFIHFFSSSDFLLVAVQFTILELALLYFFFSFCELFNISIVSKRLLFAFLFFNPMFPYISNCVLSDALFLSVSLCIFTQYLWMLKKPKLVHILTVTLLTVCAFVLRYTAICYPLVLIAVIGFSQFKWPLKIIAILAPWLFILPFIYFTSQETKKITGHAEFSVFGGWQLANNALYMYDKIRVYPRAVPHDLRSLDTMSKYYFKYIAQGNPPLDEIQGTYFIKVPNAILKPFLIDKLRKNKIKHPSSLQAFGYVSPLYNAYGKWLIMNYPLPFIRYYIWLNIKNYCVPYLEKFGSYNVGQLKVDDEAVRWFNLKGNQISIIPGIDAQKYIFFLYPFLFFSLNVMWVLCFVQFIWSKYLINQKYFLNKSILTSAVFLSVNFGFSIFATPVVLRYQIMPMIILFGFIIVLIEYMVDVKTVLEPGSGIELKEIMV